MRLLTVRSRRAGARRGDEAGASLLLAMIFVVVVGLVVGALLSLTSTSLRAVPAFDGKSQGAFAVEGALQAAVNEVRWSSYTYDSGDPNCFNGGTTPYGAAGTSRTYPTSGGNVVVTCAPGAGTGGMSENVPISANNRPGNAILSLDPVTETREPGIEINEHLLTVQGRVFSNSTIKQNGTPCPATPQPPTRSTCVELYSKVANWPVRAKGLCTGGRIVSTPPAECGFTGDAQGFDKDPNVAQPSTAADDLDLQTVPACSSNQRRITLSPGYYDDVNALNDWTDGSCNGSKTVVLAPGVYYFDFHNGQMPSGKARGVNPVERASDVWQISGSNVTVVGGTLRSGLGGTGSIPSSAIPGACVNPLDSVTAKGVTLLFGGDSRIEYDSGRVELCGTYDSSSSPVVVYGAKQDSASVKNPPTPVVPAAGQGSTPSTPKGISGFGSPGGNLQTVLATAGDNKIASTTLSRQTGQTSTAAFQLTQFTVPTGALPKGSILTAATLSVTHRETGTLVSGSNPGTVQDKLTLALTTGSGDTSITKPLTPTTGTSPQWSTQTFDVRDDLAKDLHDNGFSGLTVRYDAVAAAKTATSSGWTPTVDAVTLTLTYDAPGVRAQTTTLGGQTNCLGAIPYVPGSQNCALLAATSSGRDGYNGDGDGNDNGHNLVGQFYIQGTVYAPLAAVELILPHQNRQAVRSGIIARSVRINVRQEDERGNDRPGTVSIEVPNDSPGKLPVDVYFTAYTCLGSCTGTPSSGTGWVVAGKARVTFVDTGATVVPGSRQVLVKTWQLTR